MVAEKQRLIKGWQVVLEWGKGWGVPPPPLQRLWVTILWLTDVVDWLSPSSALPRINCIHGNELGPWTPG